MSYRAWICEGCEKPNRREGDIFDCVGCGKECCERCFDRYAHCTICAAGVDDVDLIARANATGYEFESYRDAPVSPQEPHR